MSEYTFDNSYVQETERRFRSLQLIHDPKSRSIAESLGLGVGWKCLEIGGGGGSFASWLSEKVAETGKVVVTDLDPRFLKENLKGKKNLTVLENDITKDQMPEGGPFDLIHARLVFQHVHEPDSALKKVISSLKKGGWLFIEDYYSSSQGEIIFGDEDTKKKFRKLRKVLLEIFRRHGLDDELAQRLPPLFREFGLKNVGGEINASMWAGGSTGCELWKANFDQIRKQVIDSGLMQESRFDEYVKIFETPGWGFSSPRMVSTWGSR